MWAVGDRILDTYEVTLVHEHGGMGLVYRVRHPTWNTDLAVKSPRAELFHTEADKALFTREAETWVSLGLHPHVCGCYYVRRVGDVPHVFAEYLAGGSLREWIDDRRLYQGSSTEVLERILDVAIQMARGLAHAHGLGVVHRDVKPANVLMDGAGTAKVTDFGLARARPVSAGRLPVGSGEVSILVSAGGMTRAYASPEQVAGKVLGRRSDVWSFAISVLEMFTGGITWFGGPAARAALASYRQNKHAFPQLPSSVADLLARCLRDDPGQRPGDMTEIAAELGEIFLRDIGRPYPREAARAAELRADELNNHALSLLDLGQAEQAERTLADALAADPRHLEATYNAGLLRWRAGSVSDDVLVADLEDIRAVADDPGPAPQLLGQVHLERGDADAALPLLEEAARRTPGDREVRVALARVRAGDIPGRCLRTMKDDRSLWLQSMAWSSDGHLAVSIGESAPAQVWQLDSGRVHSLDDDTTTAHLVSLSADGRFALLGCAEEVVQLWDLHDGRRLLVRTDIPPHHEQYESLPGNTRFVNVIGFWASSAALSVDGRTALFGCYDGTLQVWDLYNSRCLRTLEGHTNRLLSVALSANGRFALSGGHDRTVRWWDLGADRCLRTLAGHDDSVATVSLTADGNFGLSGGYDGTVRLWDLNSGRCVHILQGHTGYLKSVCISPRGRLGLSGGDDGMRLWDLRGGRCLRTFSSAAKAVHLSADERLAYCGGSDRSVRVWEVPVAGAYVSPFQVCRPRPQTELTQLETQVEALMDEAEQAITDRRLSAALTLLSRVRTTPGYQRAPRVLAAWRRLAPSCVRVGVRATWPVQTLTGHTGRVRSVCLSSDGAFAVSAGEDRTVRLWEPGSGRCLRVLEGHTDTVMSVWLSPDGRHALSGSSDNTVRLWDAESGRCLHVLNGHLDTVAAVRLSADERLAVSGGHDNTVRWWETSSGRCLRTVGYGRPGTVTSVCPSPDGRFVLAGNFDCSVRLWDLDSGSCIRNLQGHLNNVLSVDMTASGSLALSVADGARWWDLERGDCLRTLDIHAGDGCLSPDGRFALFDGRDRVVQLWDLDEGRCVQTMEGHTAEVTAVHMSSDGRFAISGSHDNTVRLWEIDWELDIPEQAEREGR